MNRILVIDDEPNIRESISVLLEEKGYEVQTAENGREGVKELDSFQPDLVLTDISMPDMEGIEFLKVVTREKRDLPVIVMSGNAVGGKFLKAAGLFGAASTLRKPFSNKDLLAAIERLL